MITKIIIVELLYFLFIALIALIIYFPVIIASVKLKKVENTLAKLYEELAELENEYCKTGTQDSDKSFDFIYGLESWELIETRFGEGTYPSSGVSFEKAHKNQEFAMNIVLDIVKELKPVSVFQSAI